MKKTLEVINEIKTEGLIKDYAIGGAIGVLKWVEPFFTRDLDIFIIPAGEAKKGEMVFLTAIYDFLKEKGYSEWTGQWIIVEGIPLEFIPADGLAEESVENAVETEYDGVRTRVMSPEYLIALLLSAGRQKDIMKINMLLSQAEVDRNKLNSLLSRYNLTERFRQL